MAMPTPAVNLCQEPELTPHKQCYSPRRERASTRSCLILLRLDFRCSSSSPLGG